MNAIVRRDSRCRYCDKQFRDHLGAEAACPVAENTDTQQTFVPRIKRLSVSNSFKKEHIHAMMQLCEAALTGQPLTKSFLRSKSFVNTYNKITKMQKRILQNEQQAAQDKKTRGE